MPARSRDPRDEPGLDVPERAVRDDDPVRRRERAGDDPKAIPQAAEDRGGRTHPARERDLRFGLLPALLISLTAHAALVEALGWLGFGDDSPPQLSLRGTGALGAPGGGGDGIRISLRYGGGAPAGGEDALAQATAADEITLTASAPVEPAPPESRDDVVTVPAFPDAPIAEAAPVEPVATVGEWEGPPAPPDAAPDAGATEAVLVAALSAPAAGGNGVGGLGPGEGAGSAAGSSAEAGGGVGEGSGGGRGNGPGGQNGNGVLDANPLATNEPPDYPYEARRAGEEGVVLLCAHVADDGAVTSVELLASCGHERLDRSALEAVAQWRYEPARRNGRAVAQDINIPIRFRLRPR
jgi:protein TonB